MSRVFATLQEAGQAIQQPEYVKIHHLSLLVKIKPHSLSASDHRSFPLDNDMSLYKQVDLHRPSLELAVSVLWLSAKVSLRVEVWKTGEG